MSNCLTTEVHNPFTGSNISKDSLGGIVVFIDILIVISLCVFIQVLEAAQKKYVSNFKDQTIEMTDFTLRMSGLPFDKEFGGNPDHLKVYLIAHF